MWRIELATKTTTAERRIGSHNDVTGTITNLLVYARPTAGGNDIKPTAKGVHQDRREMSGVASPGD
jgi:hypothetical protein